MDAVIAAVWRPKRNAEVTFPRRVLEVKQTAATSRAYDRVVFRRVLKDGSLGEQQSCYIDVWRSWVRRHEAEPENVRIPPPFDTQGKGLQFYAKDSSDQWFYVNHAGTWQTCPPPVVPDPA
jgi:hypothetical protein